MVKKLLLLLAFLCAFTTNVQQVQAVARPPMTNHRTQRQLTKIMKQKKVNGLVLVSGRNNRAIVLDNRVTAKKSEQVLPDRLIPIASFQKLVTGIGIQQLIDEGRLANSTSLGPFFPWMPYSSQITVQRLMTHTSGLWGSKKVPRRQLKDEHAQQNYLLSRIKSTGKFKWHYADIDFIILAALINWTSGEPYQTYISQHLLRPAGLTKMAFYNQVKNRHQLTWPLARQLSMNRLLLVLSKEYGAGDMLGTPLDYWKLVTQSLLNNPKLLNDFTAHRTNSSESYYGGVYISKDMLHANGYLTGYACTFFADYRTHKTLMLFANNLHYQELKTVSEQLYHAYFGGSWE